MLGGMTNKVTALNTLSGKVAVVNARDLTHPIFGDYLVEVPEGTKSFEASTYVPRTKDEYLESRKSLEKETAKGSDDKKVEAKNG